MADDLAALVAELKRLDAAATPGEWHTGPETGAGHVWIYVGGDPLAEPTHFRLKSFLMRRSPALREFKWVGGVQRKAASEEDFWKRKQADAALIVAARNALPRLLSALETAQRERDEARVTSTIQDGALTLTGLFIESLTPLLPKRDDVAGNTASRWVEMFQALDACAEYAAGRQANTVGLEVLAGAVSDKTFLLARIATLEAGLGDDLARREGGGGVSGYRVEVENERTEIVREHRVIGPDGVGSSMSHLDREAAEDEAGLCNHVRRAALLEAAEKAMLPGTELLDVNARVAEWLRKLAEEA